MNPNERIAQLESQVADLTRRLNALSSASAIPFEVEKALASRLTSNLQEKVVDITSAFPSNPLSVAVDEGGTSTYRVMDQPDYAIKLRLRNSYVAIPAFDY